MHHMPLTFSIFNLYKAYPPSFLSDQNKTHHINKTVRKDQDIMSYSSEESSCSPTSPAVINGRKLKGVRQRKWGKWVSEIRVPGTQDRLWLGSFSTAEAAAVARDVAYYCLRKPSTLDGLNFPTMLPCSVSLQAAEMMLSPRSIQKAASDAGMAVDAQLINANSSNNQSWREAIGSDVGESSGINGGEALSISIEDYL